jgi:hypothetical protein
MSPMDKALVIAHGSMDRRCEILSIPRRPSHVG